MTRYAELPLSPYAHFNHAVTLVRLFWWVLIKSQSQCLV